MPKHFVNKRNDAKKIFKLGFYSDSVHNRLTILVEIFENDDVYMTRIKNVLPEYMQDPVDYYRSHNV